MPIYTYKAADGAGKLVKGEIEAIGELEVTTQLAKLGYLPISISSKAEKAKPLAEEILKVGHSRPSPQSLIVFTRQFATIIKAGIPILEGLGVLTEQTDDPVLKKALAQISRDVAGGISLSQAMSKYPNVFSELYINTVIAGETAGVLENVLFKLSFMLENDYDTRANIMAALRYPIMVVIAMITAVLILSIFVVPQFAKIYMEAKMKLPLPTQIMIAFSSALRFRWYILMPLIAGAIFAFRWYINTQKGRLLWDGLKFKMAIIGKIYTKIVMLRFCSMLNVLYQAGLPVLKTMDIVGSTVGNAVLMKEVEKIKQDLSDGKGISQALLNSRFFPRLVGFMISVGEKSGSLTTMLDSLYEYLNIEVKSAIRNLTSLIEPIVTAVLGIVVLVMCLAIFLPLWNMIEVMRGGGG
jgi:type II secretory pathway component PulF